MSTPVLVLGSMVVGILIGLAISRLLGSGSGGTWQKGSRNAQTELDELKARAAEHFAQAHSSLQTLRDGARELHAQLIADAARISGLDLQTPDKSMEDTQKLAKYLIGDDTLPPLDYAPKHKGGASVLSEEYGLKDEEAEQKKKEPKA